MYMDMVNSFFDRDEDLDPLLDALEEETQDQDNEDSSEHKKPESPSSIAKSPRKRANFFSMLVDQIVEDGTLLLSEDGQAFAYQKEQGYYQPIPQLTVWLAQWFPVETTRSLLVNDLREIAQRLTWCQEIRCSRSDFNQSKELVNL